VFVENVLWARGRGSWVEGFLGYEACWGLAYISTAAQHGRHTREAQVAGHTHCLEISTPRRWWFCGGGKNRPLSLSALAPVGGCDDPGRLRNRGVLDSPTHGHRQVLLPGTESAEAIHGTFADSLASRS
jgi:hypothetical protein